MKKNLSISIVVYEMLLEVSKKSRKRPEVWLEEIVKENYKKV
tara:strand:- start:198 stop:323 length:126 start_codon:yes stop_codon:yes gene_type:complete